ncbi:MAG: IS701 family transposase [Ktedonobacteraceae bacterium]
MKPSQHNTSPSWETTLAQVVDWSEHLVQFHQRIAARFARSEPRQRALAYLKGLLSPLERKTSWQLAEQAREATPYGMQRLLHQAACDVEGLRDDVRSYALEHLGSQNTILALDETSFPKHGRHSAGVKSQWCGCTGQVQNCQVGVFLSLCTALGHTLIDRELYVPADWLADRPRCQTAAIPDTRHFQTKPELAALMLSRFLRACPTLPVSWVLADSIYGSNPDLRAFLERRHLPYVLAVSCQEPVVLSLPDGSCRRVETGAVPLLLAASLLFQPLSMGDGSKGPRLDDWARLPLLHQGRADGQHFLLIRRCREDPSLLWFFLVLAPVDTPLSAMVTAWGARWHIEEDFEAGKDLGLDQYQVRSFTGWYRHVTFVLLALAFLRSLCVLSPTAPLAQPAPEPLPLTPREIRHVLALLLWPAPSSPPFVLAWSLWRRRHQRRARFFHTQRRARPG